MNIVKLLSLMISQANWDNLHCVKGVRIRIFSGPYFPAFGLNMERSVN